MSETPNAYPDLVREAVGIFRNQDDLQAAIDDLTMSGFARCELSLLGSGHAPAGHPSPEDLADDPTTPRTDHFCTEALGNAEGGLIGGFAILPAMGGAWAAAAAGASVAAATGLAVVHRRRRSAGRGGVRGSSCASPCSEHFWAGRRGGITALGSDPVTRA